MRPARLPIPPSRPGRTSVTARTALAGLAAFLLIAVGCVDGRSPSGSTVPTIAFLFDGSLPDAELATSPALAGLELAAREAGGVDVEPVNVGEPVADVTAALEALGDDRGVVAAVVAPWTAPPEGAIERLAADGVPVVTLSWAWGPPDAGGGLWLSFVAGRALEAVLLLERASSAHPEGGAVCLAGDDHVTSRALLRTAEQLGEAAGEPVLRTAGVVRTGLAATAEAVAARAADAGCPTLVWIGSAPAAASVVSRIPDPPAVVGTSRIKTDDGLALGSSGVAVRSVCGCVDVSLSIRADGMRFVHDVQAASGAPPGPLAVEAYDAGRLLTALLGSTDGTRRAIARAIDDLTHLEGLAASYAFEPDGARAPEPLAFGFWRAAGSRWLPSEG